MYEHFLLNWPRYFSLSKRVYSPAYYTLSLIIKRTSKVFQYHVYPLFAQSNAFWCLQKDGIMVFTTLCTVLIPYKCCWWCLLCLYVLCLPKLWTKLSLSPLRVEWILYTNECDFTQWQSYITIFLWYCNFDF